MSRRAAARIVVRAARRAPVRSAKCAAWFVVAYVANVLAHVAERARDELSYLDDYAYDRARALDFRADELSCMGQCSTHPGSDDRPCPGCLAPPGYRS